MRTEVVNALAAESLQKSAAVRLEDMAVAAEGVAGDGAGDGDDSGDGEGEKDREKEKYGGREGKKRGREEQHGTHTAQTGEVCIDMYHMQKKKQPTMGDPTVRHNISMTLL